MVDYHVWDNIELSDDDCERLAHPNVDQPSLERWLRTKYYDTIEEQKEHMAQRDEARKKNLEELETLQRLVQLVPPENTETREKVLVEIENRKKFEIERVKEDEEAKKHPKWNIETICRETANVSVINWTPEKEPELSDEEYKSFLKLSTYNDTHTFINTHGRKVLNESMIQKCFQSAWEKIWDGKKKAAKMAVRQALIIQYCLAFSERGDGVYWFFKRLQSDYSPYSKETFEQELEERFQILQKNYETKKAQIETAVDVNGELIYQSIEPLSSSSSPTSVNTDDNHDESFRRENDLYYNSSPNSNPTIRRRKTQNRNRNSSQQNDNGNENNDENDNDDGYGNPYRSHHDDPDHIPSSGSSSNTIEEVNSEEELETKRQEAFKNFPKPLQDALNSGNDEELNAFFEKTEYEDPKEYERITKICYDLGIIQRHSRQNNENENENENENGLNNSEEFNLLNEEIERRRKVFQSLPKEIQNCLLKKDSKGLNEFINSLTKEESEKIIGEMISVGLVSKPKSDYDFWFGEQLFGTNNWKSIELCLLVLAFCCLIFSFYLILLQL